MDIFNLTKDNFVINVYKYNKDIIIIIYDIIKKKYI